MAKRRSSKSTNLSSELDDKYEYDDEFEEDVLEEITARQYNDRVKLRLKIGVKSFSIDGPVSGEHYKWLGAGSYLEVLQEDVADLLAKRLGARSCCGGDSNFVFEIVEE